MRLRTFFPGACGLREARGVLLAGALAAAAAACSSGSAPTTFDLSAPGRGGGRAGAGGAQIVVNEPVSIQALEGDRIIVKEPAGSVSFVSGGQWADRLPRLVQARLIQTFENSSRMKAVSRPGDRVSA